jgi:hypothetical protein
MKIYFYLLFVLFCYGQLFAQYKVQPTNQFVIEGLVKVNTTIEMSDFKNMAVVELGDIEITNHLGEKKSTLQGVKGVSLKDLLQKTEINVESPKQLSEFYFVLTASDLYSVVYSWNELFNSPTGNKVFLIVERDGLKIEDTQDHISAISPTDYMTGRRYVKGLNKIMVKRIEK